MNQEIIHKFKLLIMAKKRSVMMKKVIIILETINKISGWRPRTLTLTVSSPLIWKLKIRMHLMVVLVRTSFEGHRWASAIAAGP